MAIPGAGRSSSPLSRMSQSMVLDASSFRGRDRRGRSPGRRRRSRRQSEDPLHGILPRTVRYWIPDANAHACYGCGTAFGLLVRKHHCRVCGRVFCGTCTQYRDSVPRVISEQMPASPPKWWADQMRNWIRPEDPTTSKMCRRCHQRVGSTKRAEKLIEAFVLLAERADVGLPEWYTMRQVCRSWNKACNVLLSLWRETQYLLPYQRVSDTQRTLLQVNARWLRGHGRWEAVAAQHNIAVCGKTHVPCEALMCSRTCRSMDVVSALTILERDRVARSLRVRACRALQEASADLLLPFVPALVRLAAHDEYLLREMVLPACVREARFGHAVYWQARGGAMHVANAVADGCGPEGVKMRHSARWAHWVAMCLAEGRHGTWEDHGVPVCFPTQPMLEVLEVVWDGVTRKVSHSCPTVVPLRCRYANGPPYIQYVLYKPEDVRKDARVMAAVSLLQKLVHRDEGLFAPTVAYPVVPLDERSGFVLMVGDSVTLYSVAVGGTSLQNYVIERSGKRSVQEMRTWFLTSCAFCSVLSLILGLGDRHLENMMLTADGTLFHIDFGYILGEEPPVKSLTANTMKLTPQIVDALGGAQSASFSRFQATASLMFNCARRYAHEFFAVLHPLVRDGIVRAQDLERHMDTRFLPGESYEEAKFQIQDQIVRDAHHRTLDAVMDTIHHLRIRLKL